MAMDELYLENIDELVTDQNKIVTYKWLSHTLGVHVNQAKQMLYDYVTRKRKENTSAQVHVTYLVTGKCIQNGYSFHKVAVVKEEKLEATKAKLTVVANVHVYSIQKASLKDSAPLFNTDYDIIKNNLQNCNKFSAIQCPEAVPRSAEEMSQLRNANCPQTEEVHVPPKPAINGHIPAPTAPKANTQQTKGIMGMFNRPASKPPETQKETKSEPTEPAVTASGSKASAKSNAMNNFFGKASLNKIRDVSSTKDAIKEEKAASPTPPPVRDETPPEQAVKPPEKAVKPSEPAKAPSKEKKRIKRAEMSDSDEEGEKVVKKRRRIKRPKSDSSDDETGPPPPEVKTPSPPPSPPHPPPPEPALKTEAESQSRPQPGGKRRKRKRVLKSKTFLDEDGSIVTEKAYVSESCTDSEEEFTKPKPAAVQKPSTTGAAKQEPKETKTSKKASVAKGGTKQASIMGFFQKK